MTLAEARAPGAVAEAADRIPTPGDVALLGIPRWYPHRHLIHLNIALTRALAVPNSFLVIEAPVRHGKSRLVTEAGSAWAMLRWPDQPVLLGCHTDGLARRFGRSARRIVRALGPDLGLAVSPHSHSASEFDLVGHPDGGFKAVGVGSTPTGSGGQRIFVDDPVRHLKQLRTIEQRDELWEWLTGTMRTRLHAGGSMVLVMSRWHEDDPVGRIFSAEYGTGDPWQRVTLPAVARADDPMGREPGEALAPEMGYTAEVLAQTRETVGPRIWGANYDQHPQTPEGRMFRPERWGFTAAVPAGSSMVRWWDNAATRGGSGAFTAGVLLALTPTREWVVVDVYRERVGSADRRAAQRTTAIADNARWGRIAAGGRVLAGAEQEPGSGGKDQAELFVTDVMQGLPAVAETTGGQSKEVRAELWAAQQGAGRVAILTDPAGVPPEWASRFIAEHTDFPLGATKDQVDAASHASTWLALRAPRGSTGAAIASTGGRALRTGTMGDRPRLR